MQRKKKVWPICRKKKKLIENFSENAEILDLLEKDFK